MTNQSVLTKENSESIIKIVDKEVAVIPSGVEIIEAEALSKCTAKIIFLPNTIKKIQDFAAYWNENLEYINIPSSVKRIGDCAFYMCENLKVIDIPNSTTSVGECAFGLCRSLMQVNLSTSLKRIREKTFFGCEDLEEVVLPAGITSIDKFAFCGCTSLKSIVIPDAVEKIGTGSFLACMSLQKVQLSKCLKRIGDYSFCWCLPLMLSPSGIEPFPNQKILGRNVFAYTWFREPDSLNYFDFLDLDEKHHLMTLKKYGIDDDEINDLIDLINNKIHDMRTAWLGTQLGTRS